MLFRSDRAEANPGNVAAKAWNAAAFPNHPYGRPTEGTRESLPTLTREDLAGFVRGDDLVAYTFPERLGLEP